MLKRFASLSLISAALFTPAWAQTFVDDDFEGYSDVTAMQAAWVSTTSSTTSTYLIDPNFPGQPFPAPPTPGYLDGNAALFDGAIGAGAGSVNKWATPFTAKPSATQNVFLSVDLGFNHQDNDPTKVSNKKLTVGLRYTGAATENIIELGFYNGIAALPFRQVSHRTTSFASGNPNPNPEAPGWEYYGLDTTYDQMTEMDHSGNPLTNGLGFHRFTATISLTDVTYTIDLFADGINNVTGQPGVDAIDIRPAVATINGFNDLRFGIPSASGSSANPLFAVDNVLLQLVDIPVNTGDLADFEPDGDIDGRDFLTWQRNVGVPDAQRTDGDADGDGDVDGDDLGIWQDQYDLPYPGGLSALNAVPEPSTAVMLFAACASLLMGKRR